MAGKSINYVMLMMFLMVGAGIVNGLGIFSHNYVASDPAMYESFTTTNLTHLQPSSTPSFFDYFAIMGGWLLNSAFLFFGLLLNSITFWPTINAAFGPIPAGIVTIITIIIAVQATLDVIAFLSGRRLGDES